MCTIKRIASLLSSATFFILAISITSTSEVKAQQLEIPEISVTGQMYNESRYLFRGVEFIEEANYYSLTAASGNLYAGFWLVDDHSNLYHETDVYLGYYKAISSKYAVDVMFNHYLLQESDNNSELFVTQSLAFNNNISFGLQTAYNFAWKNIAVEPFMLAHFDIKSLQIDSKSAYGNHTLGDNAWLYGVTDTNLNSSYNYLYTTLDLSYQLTPKMGINYGIRYTWNDAEALGYSTKRWFKFGLNFSL